MGVKVGFTDVAQGQLRLAMRLLSHLAAGTAVIGHFTRPGVFVRPVGTGSGAGFAVATLTNTATMDMRLAVFMLAAVKASEL